MDYEKHLKETLSDVNTPYVITAWIEENFPELRDSEDEKIRKEITELVMQPTWKTEKEFHRRKELVAWLEKQESVGEIIERCKNSWYNEGKIDGMAEGLTNDEKYQQGWHDALEKQKNDSYLQEKIENFTNAHKGEDPESIIAACRGGEKQGEKTVIGNGSNSVSVSDGDTSVTSKEVVSYPTTSTTIEPKFNVGDWIVDNNGTVHHIEEIVSVNNETLYGCDDNSVLDVAFQEQYHLWTINDAMDGDVLYSPCLSLLWIFKSKDTVYCGCNLNYNDGAFCGEGYFERPTDAIPATKEQCNLLLQKMKEEGYEWDAEEKDLIKVKLTEWIPKNGDVVRLKEDNGQRWTISLSAEPDTYEKWFLSLNTKDGVAGGWVSDYLLKENYTFVNNPLEEAKQACKEETTKLGKAIAEAVKPTEWSEEDEKILGNIRHIISEYDKITKKANEPCWYIGDCLLWLQDIELKGLPQSKQEWSEKDETGWTNTMIMIKECASNHYTKDSIKLVVDWLKSLKERMKGE